MWITLGNKAVMDDLNRLMKRRLIKKADDGCIRDALRQSTKESRTWRTQGDMIKRPAEEEDIAAGKSTIVYI